MNEDVLFDSLDLDGDGILSRGDVQWAARQFGWQWQQASIFAFLDLMTVRSPLDKETFISIMNNLAQDRDGAYGEVLRMVPYFAANGDPTSADSTEVANSTESPLFRDVNGIDKIIAQLENTKSEALAADFKSALKQLNSPRLQLSTSETALLIIDPQRSFTSGSWKRSLGSDGDMEVLPILAAFGNCANLLRAVYQRTDVMFSRCPFPPESYDWDEQLEGIIGADQLYFIKPGNSVLHPPTNGCREWVEGLIDKGKNRLVMGGCTLNSCIRISSLETLSAFRDKGLEVVVDLSLCGARSSSYLNSPQFGGISAVETAMKQMTAEGVKVTEGVEWL